MANAYFLSTTAISAEKSVFEIKVELMKIGVQRVYEEYSQGKISAIVFSLDSGKDRPLDVNIPVNVENIFLLLKAEHSQKKRTRAARPKDEALLEQAHRTAWRMALQRIKLQVADIMVGQMDALEVFLPYVMWKGVPFYQALKSQDFKLLGEGTR
jgi:hypothetical protein